MVKIAAKITSWSMSRFNDYTKCPALAKYKHIDKLKEPGNEAMQRGTEIHKLAEDYVKGLIPKLPAPLALFKDEFTKLKKVYKVQSLPIFVEDQWAFKADWSETQWNNWADCWLRVKVDLAYQTDADSLQVVDYKTGKMNDYKAAEYMMQLELYALAALQLSINPNLTVFPKLWYLDQGVQYPPEPIKYVKKDLPELKKKWLARVKPMLNDTKFAPRASNNCRYCYFSAAKAGPCKY